MKYMILIILFILTASNTEAGKGLYAKTDRNFTAVKKEVSREIQAYRVKFLRERRLAGINRVLSGSGSPMGGSENDLLSVSESFGIDYRLVLGIARKESQFGKLSCPNDKYNVFGIDSCGKRIIFDSYKHAYTYLATLLKTNGFYAKWRQTGELWDLMSVYCPPFVNGVPECNTKLYVSQLESWMKEF